MRYAVPTLSSLRWQPSRSSRSRPALRPLRQLRWASAALTPPKRSWQGPKQPKRQPTSTRTPAGRSKKYKAQRKTSTRQVETGRSETYCVLRIAYFSHAIRNTQYAIDHGHITRNPGNHKPPARGAAAAAHRRAFGDGHFRHHGRFGAP